MKTLLKVALLFIFPLLMVSCGGDDIDEPDMPTGQPSQNDTKAEYYVRYDATISTSKQSTFKYSVSTDSGSKTFETEAHTFSETFGPVKKGFIASIFVDASNLSYAANCSCVVKIYVCRGKEPFALKATASGDKTATTSYTIDF